MQILTINNLTKMYSDTKGIKNISFSITEKECVAIIGKSGSGKSTLLKCILNLTLADSGKIKIYDNYLKDNYEDLIRVIGYLPDKQNQFPKQKLKDFIKIINTYYNLDYTADILEYIKLFNLDLNSDISKLSSGETQKLSLILTLFHKPKFLLLDEPTNFLDTTSIHTLTQILKKLKYEGTSILIVSHSLNFILELADRIYLLNDFNLLDIKNKLKENDYKKITIALENEITYKDLNLKGVSNISLNNKAASFIFTGDIAYLLKKLASFLILDIVIENPTVEDLLGGLLHDLS